MATPKSIPSTAFRLEHGYSFLAALETLQIDPDNLLVGAAQSDQPEAVYVGKLAEFQAMQRNVWLDIEGAHAVYLMGKRRSGKSFTLGVLAEGLVSKQWIRQGELKQGVLILDTMNVFLTMSYEAETALDANSPSVQENTNWGLSGVAAPQVQFFYPKASPAPPEGAPIELSLRACDLNGDEWAALFEVDTFSDPIGQLISEIYELVAIEGYEAKSGQTLPPNREYTIDDMLRCLDESRNISRFENRTVEAVRRRLKAVRRTAVISDEGSDVRQLFRPGQISILLLRDIDHSLRSLLIAVIVKKIMQLRSYSDKYERLAAVNRQKWTVSGDPQSKAKTEEYEKKAKEGISRGWIVIDEAHNYIPSKGILPSKGPLIKYVNEGRNLGLSIVVATQHPAGLDPSIQRNADVLFVHSMSMRDDIETAEGMVNTFIPESVKVGTRERITSRLFEQLVRSLPLGYAVVSNDRVNRIFVVKVRPRLTVHGGTNY